MTHIIKIQFLQKLVHIFVNTKCLRLRRINPEEVSDPRASGLSPHTSDDPHPHPDLGSPERTCSLGCRSPDKSVSSGILLGHKSDRSDDFGVRGDTKRRGRRRGRRWMVVVCSVVGIVIALVGVALGVSLLRSNQSATSKCSIKSNFISNMQ